MKCRTARAVVPKAKEPCGSYRGRCASSIAASSVDRLPVAGAAAHGRRWPSARRSPLTDGPHASAAAIASECPLLQSTVGVSRDVTNRRRRAGSIRPGTAARREDARRRHARTRNPFNQRAPWNTRCVIAR